MLADIQQAFSACNENIKSNALLEKCEMMILLCTSGPVFTLIALCSGAALCKMQQISADKLATQWEVFVMNRKTETKLSMETLDLLSNEIRIRAVSQTTH